MMMKQQHWKWMSNRIILPTTTPLELEEDDEAGIFSPTDASRSVLTALMPLTVFLHL